MCALKVHESISPAEEDSANGVSQWNTRKKNWGLKIDLDMVWRKLLRKLIALQAEIINSYT